MLEPELARPEILFFPFDSDPAATEPLSDSTGGIRAGKRVENEIVILSDQFDKKLRKCCREPRRVNFDACGFATLRVSVVGRVVAESEQVVRRFVLD